MLKEFMDKLRAGWAGNCETCGRYSKVYHRSIHTSVALQLIHLYRIGGYEDYFHASRLIAKGVSGSGDFSKAKYWGLIEEAPHKQSDKKSSGYWRLTQTGLEFVRGELSIKKYAVVYDDRVIDVVGCMTNIKDCLKNKFNYDDLMSGVA